MIPKEKTAVRNYTNGSIPKQLLLFAFPFMASNALQVLYSLVDMLIVGQFVGSFGLSAVSTASQVFTFATMLCLGFSTGGQVLIAQLVGAGKKDRISSTVGTLFSVLVLAGLLMSAAILLFHRAILTLLSTPPEAAAMASHYLIVCGIGLLFTFGYNMVSAVFRGMGDSKHPFYFILLASLLNLLLDLLFTGLFQWGVAGATLATIIGQAVSFFCAIAFLYRNRTQFFLSFSPADFTIKRPIFLQLARLGIPFAIQSCAVNLSMLFVNRLINQLGVYASAVYGVGVKLDDIVNKLSQAVMHAASPIIGQNIAAGKPERAKQTVYSSWIYCGIFYLIFSVVYLNFCQPMFGLFTDDQEVIKLAPVFVSAILWSFPSMVLMRGSNAFVQGIGNASFSMLLGLLDGFVCRILLSYVLGIVLDMGLFGFILGYGLASYASTVPATIYFFLGRWKNRKTLV